MTQGEKPPRGPMERLDHDRRLQERAPLDAGEFATDFGAFDSLADLFRQIGYDERMLRIESELVMSQVRFG